MDRNILTNVVPVPGWILDLELMKHPHQMEQFTDVEEPILHRMSGEADNLCDDGHEVIAHELGTVVPVAHPRA